MTALYNEIDDYAADWLENLIAAGHIAPGVVDRRSIVDLEPSDLVGFTQVHFFAGIAGWSLAARLAGWPDDRPLWTGSCPCQPFSVAGSRKGIDDERHLWPEMFRLIEAIRPPVVMGEQVAAAVGKSWLDGVCSDLEGIGYATGAAVVPACAVDAPHRRDRLWFVADSDGSLHNGTRRLGTSGRAQYSNGGCTSSLANSDQPSAGQGWEQRSGQLGGVGSDTRARALGDGDGDGLQRFTARRDIDQANGHDTRRSLARGSDASGGFWSRSESITGADGKARRVKPGIRLLANGVSARVGKLRAFGNAIVPQVAAEVIRAYMDCTS